ncbi:hypothetical protein A2U01_0080100, partial [Trifolium medium]|nr:hypothetical protein [Trifolium medium]
QLDHELYLHNIFSSACSAQLNLQHSQFSSTMSSTFNILSSTCSAQPNLQHSKLSSTMSSTFSILNSARL